MNWYVICDKDGNYWIGERDKYSTSLEFAKLFTEEEKELSFILSDETWYQLQNHGNC